MIAPCEDCLSWLNTNRYFNIDTLVFSFERIKGELVVRASKLSDFLPYKNIKTSLEFNDKKEVFVSNKFDWTKRWHNEPLGFCAVKAIEKFGIDTKIQAICYFGDENSNDDNGMYYDGLVSIKSLGCIRQKYASTDTLMVLNFNDYIKVVTIGEYLPKKFEQGYKI